MIGADAATDWLPTQLLREGGYIRTGREVTDFTGWTANRTPFLLETNLPGIFCVGDVRYNSIKRVSSSVGEGSMAIAFVHQYLSLMRQPNESRKPSCHPGSMDSRIDRKRDLGSPPDGGLLE
jgi:thioredoxin reductase (NADPH)